MLVDEADKLGMRERQFIMKRIMELFSNESDKTMLHRFAFRVFFSFVFVLFFVGLTTNENGPMLCVKMPREHNCLKEKKKIKEIPAVTAVASRSAVPMWLHYIFCKIVCFIRSRCSPSYSWYLS